MNLLEMWNGNNWINFWFSTFEYSTEWILSSILTEVWDGIMWNNYARLSFIYSLPEPQKIGTVELWDNNKWVYNERFLYSYDSENYFTHGFYEYWINNSWIPGDGVISVYNPDGFDIHFLTNELIVYYNPGTDVKDEQNNLTDFKLHQNYPNPFNPTTIIKYSVPFDSKVKIVVYNIAGEMIKELVNSVVTAGSHKVEFNLNGLHLSSGIYFYAIEANALDGQNSFRETKKMVLLK